MAGTNEILTFALNTGANVLAQSSWASASARGSGFVSGVADSASVNKALRQAAFVAASVAQWAVDQTSAQNMSILDNGDVANVKAVLVQAVQNLAYAAIAAGNYATVAALNAASAALNTSLAGEAAIRAAADSTEAAARIAADSAEASARANADTSEANARAAADAAIWAYLPNYMTRGSTGGNNATQVFTPAANSTTSNFFNLTTSINGLLFIVCTAHVTTPPQPISCVQHWVVDGVEIANEAGVGSITLQVSNYLPAGAHSFVQSYTVPNFAGSYSLMDLRYAWVFVEV